MSETTETNNLTLFVNYKDIPGALLCRWIDRRGLAFKIPRSQFKKEMLDKFPESGYDTFRDKACVYILFGENENGDVEAYIGESVAIDTRLGTHAFTSKGWAWQDVFVFCRNDLVFDKTHVLYMEEQLILKAKGCRIPLRNSRRANEAEAVLTINSEYKRAADDFVEGIQILCDTFGYKLFVPQLTAAEYAEVAAEVAAEVTQAQTDKASAGANLLQDLPTFEAESSGRYKATGKPTGIGKAFMVLAGSTISSTEADSIPPSAKDNRTELQASGVIKDFRFEQDYVFRSPTAAAGVVGGASVNGNTFWVGLDSWLNSRDSSLTAINS